MSMKAVSSCQARRQGASGMPGERESVSVGKSANRR